jgi:hypothetical protein
VILLLSLLHRHTLHDVWQLPALQQLPQLYETQLKIFDAQPVFMRLPQQQLRSKSASTAISCYKHLLQWLLLLLLPPPGQQHAKQEPPKQECY